MSKNKALLNHLQRHIYDALLDLNGIATTHDIVDQIAYKRGKYYTVGTVAISLCYIRGKGFVRGPREGVWYVPYTYKQKYGSGT